jgi:hypothetical protein
MPLTEIFGCNRQSNILQSFRFTPQPEKITDWQNGKSDEAVHFHNDSVAFWQMRKPMR